MEFITTLIAEAAWILDLKWMHFGEITPSIDLMPRRWITWFFMVLVFQMFWKHLRRRLEPLRMSLNMHWVIWPAQWVTQKLKMLKN